MKTKDQMNSLSVARRCYSNIADLQTLLNLKLVVVMRDNANRKDHKKFKISSSHNDFRIISAQLVSNCKLGQLDQQAIRYL
jgi:hypothetical protein